jgi:hypothetical protein
LDVEFHSQVDFAVGDSEDQVVHSIRTLLFPAPLAPVTISKGGILNGCQKPHSGNVTNGPDKSWLYPPDKSCSENKR